MNLYLVTCVCVYLSTNQTEKLNVYVVATNLQEARDAALRKMRHLEYKYDDRVDNVAIVAHEKPGEADSLLIIANQPLG